MKSMETMDNNVKRFGIIDYFIFVGMLILSGLIGVYFGFIKKSVSRSEYFIGGRNMKVVPVALSLIVSWFSGISFMGIPTDVYLYGIHYSYSLLGFFIMAFILSENYIPVFHQLKLTSVYEYLGKRFDNRVRLLGSVLDIISNIAWLPIVIYVPALVFSQVSGVNLHFVSPVVCIVCIFYTSVGGMKAVVWADVAQATVMYTAAAMILVKGTMDTGGISAVWMANYNTSRIELPSFSFDITSSYTFWSFLIGSPFMWLTTNAIHQIMVQRYLCLPSVRHAKLALAIYSVGISFMMLLCCYIGLLIYTRYQDCDPLTTKVAKAKDQLLPLFVIDILGDYPGCQGVFVAAIFSASLSSMSSGLNSISALITEDFCSVLFRRPLQERQHYIIMRCVVVVVGVLCVGLVFVVEKLGTVLQLTFTLEAICSGPLLGIFSAGLFFPRISSKDVLAGGLTGFAFMSWLAFGMQAAIANGDLTYESKSVSVEGCSNFTYVVTNSTEKREVFGLYKVSYMWHGLIGSSITVVVSFILSFFTEVISVDEELLSPMIKPFVKSNVIRSSKRNNSEHMAVELRPLKKEILIDDQNI